MKDKEIRKILIAYLEARQECRIYQEKTIGSAICDIMQVTDRLIGYEIKSDSDNYSRLDRQVRFYDKMFDENYIVVSSKHIKSAEGKVPYYWGIVYVDEQTVKIVRAAGQNKKVSRRNQLSLLWKLELKNLLQQNGMPCYPQKGKGFIADKIAEKIDPKLLGKQIAEELLRRDYSSFFRNDEFFENLSVCDIADTLSEENLDDVTLDKWIEIYQTAKQIKGEKEGRCAKTEYTPHDITYEQIEVSLGVPWVSREIINDFAVHISGEKQNFVEYEPISGTWFINGKRRYSNAEINAKYGTERYSALFILEAILNLREIKIYDKNGEFDEAETIAALDKKEVIEKEFKHWVWSDRDRIWEIEEAYNKMFAKYSALKFDGKGMEFPEMNSDFELYDYQRAAVERIISTPNTLLAFDVGAGKTYIMIAAAMKMREMGISRKNMFVVPNNIVGQWEMIFTTFYPKARILTVEPKSFRAEMRQKILAQIKNGDYDGIIIAYSSFELIPISVEYLTQNMNKRINEIMAVAKGKGAVNREIRNIRKLTEELLDDAQNRENCITFDELEIGTIFLDEAHNFKNIPIQTRMKNLRGINTRGSKSCLAMLQKIRCVQRANNGRGAVFATGTPLSNSISDAYTMQMYLQYDDLRERQLDKFDNWVKTFAVAEQNCEIDVTAAGYRLVTRFTRFFNLPELAKMFSGIADFYSVGDESCLPRHREYKNIQIEKSIALSDYMQKIVRRTEDIRSGVINPKYDNMLKVSTDGRKAAIDLTLVGEKQTYDDYSKLVRCAEQVIEIHKMHPECSQLVFCDYSTPKAEGFCVYEKLKALLIAEGLAPHEIAFIHSYGSEARRLKLYEDVNRGTIKVLIGSTFKLGIGANVQTKLKAVHHLDVPWRPADMTQREGRILRRGNENEKIMIFRYITKGSFDSYSWQILETKQRFISQFLSGSPYQRSIEDLENNVLTYAEVKAIALANPIMKQIAQKEREASILQILCNKQAETRRRLEEQLKKAEDALPIAEARYQNTLKNARYLKTITNDKYLAAMRASKELLTEDALAGDISKKIGTFLKFDIFTEGCGCIILKRFDAEYSVEMGKTAENNIKRVVSFLKRFDKTVKNENNRMANLKREISELKTALSLPDDAKDKLKKCKKELETLMSIEKRVEK